MCNPVLGFGPPSGSPDIHYITAIQFLKPIASHRNTSSLRFFDLKIFYH